MATSLAEQLKRLQVPQTEVLKRSKKRASLIFDSREAAKYDTDTVYQIGLDGLTDLISRDNAFEEFQNTLFHVSSKTVERAVETVEANKRLDKNIKKFLLLLSPQLMFNSSLKALEWLVYRFHIHRFNKEDLLMLILPYHEVDIFVKVLQILDVKSENDKWNWLLPLQKPQIHLPKQSLYNHAASDPFFLEFVSKFVLTIIREFEKPASLTIIYNFYCTTFVGAIEYSREVNESQVSHMLPVILKGLVSDIPDFVAASYIITAKLLSQVQLGDKILLHLMEKIVQMNAPKLKTEACLTIAVLYRSQKQFSKISDAAFTTLMNKEDLTKLLRSITEDGVEIYQFIRALVLHGFGRIIQNEDNKADVAFVNNIFDEMKIKDEFIDDLMTSILNLYSENSEKSKIPKQAVACLKTFVRKIERQYPNAFDGVVKRVLAPTNSEFKHHRRALRKLVHNFTFLGNNYELFEKLYHANSNIRIVGLNILKKHFDGVKERDVVMLENFLTDALNDDNVQVVDTALSLFNNEFSLILNRDSLCDILIKLLSTYPKDEEAWKVTYGALDIICRDFTNSNIKVLLAVLPYLLPTSDDELKAAKQILTSNFAKKWNSLKTLRKELQGAVEGSVFCELVQAALSSNSSLPYITAVLEVIKQVPEENRNALHKQMVVILLSNCLPENNPPEVSALVLDVFEIYFRTTSISTIKGDCLSSDYIIKAKNNKFTLQGFLRGISTLITKTEKGVINFGSFDFSSNEEITKLFIRLLKLLLEGCCGKKTKSSLFLETLSTFFQHFCGSSLVLIAEPLLNVSIAENELIDDNLRISCLKIIKELVQKDKSTMDQFLEFDVLIVPYILVSLNMPNAEIRELSLQLLQDITNTSDFKSDNYAKLLKKLVKYEEEIRLDNEQMPAMIFKILSTTNETLVKTLKELLKIALNSANPTYLQAGIVTMLSFINDKDTYKKFSKLSLDILAKYENGESEMTVSDSTIIYKNLLRFDSNVASALQVGTPTWDLIIQSILNDKTKLKYQLITTCPAVFVLEQIDIELFSNLKLNVKNILLDTIIEIATITKNVQVSNAVNHIFKKIDLNASLVTSQLQKMLEVKSKEVEEKRKTAIIPKIDILETKEWKKGITVLEFIQDKKKFTNTVVLLPILFGILKKCLDFDEQASLEYAKQLLLSAILHCCNKMEDGQALPENTFNIHSVVQCIRASQNPQTHHHALVLLAHTAALIPKQVMHNIITIFTFVGSSVLRHDDVYSFQIMTKIIDTIIPILIEDNSKENICNILRVFVDAILDVPEHRRMPLFTQLLTSLNPKENLYLFLLIIFEAQVSHTQEEKQKSNKDRLLANAEYVPKRLTIASDLIREFSIETTMVSFIKIFQYLHKLPEQKDTSAKVESYVFNMNRFTVKQFRHYKYTIVTFLSNFLSSPQFVNKVALVTDSELLQMEGLFKEFIVHNLNFIQETSKIAQRNATSLHAHYWKVVLHHSYDILDAVNALLPPQMFLLVIHGLMVYSLTTVRKRAFELLNNKLQYNIKYFENCDKNEIYNILVTSIINIIKTSDESELDSDQELIMQKALFSLKLFSKMLSMEFPEKFVEILDFLATLSKNPSGKYNENIIASLILCIAEMCNSLKAYSIPCLNKFMPSLLKLLKSQKNLTSPNLLITSDVTAIHKILDCLALFMSPYIEKILYEISILSCKWNQSDDQKLGPFLKKLSSIRQKLGSSISIMVLLPAIENCYNKLVSKANYSAINSLMAVLSESFTHLQAADIQANLSELTNFFLNALQLRAAGTCTHAEANEVEEYIIKALMALTLKLSESNFRPLYCQLYDWAIHANDKSERVITFYNLSNAFANSLKGIFSLFAGQFLNNAAKLLDNCNITKSQTLYFEEDEKNIALVEYILKTLQAVFIYDNHKFVNKTRFKIIMQPLVDQLENTLGGSECLQQRASKILTPCIVQFAVATADDSLWKDMNYQILLKMKHDSAQVRLVALHCLGETAKKLGEDFMILVPETIPFLAELMEDDEEEVEKACKKMLQELERSLGTSLQEYF